MSDRIKVSGMVLSAMPIGENDRRVVILTRELGRISAFARGARRPGNTLMAQTGPFVTGEFSLIAGKSSYVVTGASVKNYFTELAVHQPEIYFGFYFLDFADYYGREGIDGTDMLNLLYLSVSALLRPGFDRHLVRRIFELRMMTINGDYAAEPGEFTGGGLYTVRYITGAPLTKLFSFSVVPEILEELGRSADRSINRIMDRPLKSRKIMEEMDQMQTA